MRRKRTHIFLVLDRSGSMHSRKDDHIGGLKTFVEKQKTVKPKPRFTLVQFDSQNPFELIYDGVDIGKVAEIKLEPRGSTPLMDAVGKTISHAATNIKDNESPVFVIITDGQENYSTEWDKEGIAKAIKEKEVAGWNFIFIGAGIDAFAEGNKMGLRQNTSASVANTTRGIGKMYKVVETKLSKYASTMDSAELNFSDEDRNSLSAM